MSALVKLPLKYDARHVFVNPAHITGIFLPDRGESECFISLAGHESRLCVALSADETAAKLNGVAPDIRRRAGGV